MGLLVPGASLYPSWAFFSEISQVWMDILDTSYTPRWIFKVNISDRRPTPTSIPQMNTPDGYNDPENVVRR